MFAVMPSDSRKPPPPHGLKRPQSQPGAVRDNDTRDVEGYEARKARELAQREAAPELGNPFGREDLTDRFEGEELAARRAERPIGERVAILEVKHDNVRSDIAALRLVVGDARLEAQAARVKADVVIDRVAGVKADVAGVLGRIDGQDKVLETIAGDVRRFADREHISVMRRVEIDKAGQLAAVDVQRAEALAEVDIRKEQELDAIKRTRYRRKITLAIVGLLGSGAGLIKLIELIVKHL